MPLRTLVLLLLVAVLALFTALNWSAFMAPTTLSLAFATVQAPLGLIMLGVTAILATLFLLYLVYIQTTVILDARRTARDLQAQRELADQAEASRFTALQALLESRLQKLEDNLVVAQGRTGSRLDQIDVEVRSSIERATNTLAAYIGEAEDRIERRLDGSKGATQVA